jgi:hypothetical protein
MDAYQPVLGAPHNGDDGDDEWAAIEDENNPDGHFNDDDDHEPAHRSPKKVRMAPLEVEQRTPQNNNQIPIFHDDDTDTLFVWQHMSMAVTVWFVFPALIMAMAMTFAMTGRIWTCLVFALHLTLSSIKARVHTNELLLLTKKKNGHDDSNNNNNNSSSSYRDNDDHINMDDDDGEYGQGGYNMETTMTDHHDHHDYNPPGIRSTSKKGILYLMVTSTSSLMDLVLFGIIYPILIQGIDSYLVDSSDGTLIIDWVWYHRGFHTVKTLGYIIVLLRILIGGRILLVACIPPYYLTTMTHSLPFVGSCILQPCYQHSWVSSIKVWFQSPPKPRILWQSFTFITSLAACLFWIWTIYSFAIHFLVVSTPQQQRDDVGAIIVCDPLDMTECCFPFPSMHYLRINNDTETGYSVNLQPDTLPRLIGNIPIDPTFLNKLDGFSTMGPILFYLEGMKESHDAYMTAVHQNSLLKQPQRGITRLRGHEELELSITPYSTTLFLDVELRVLVPHSAEIDYLDPERPVVMVFPAAPLRHNAHYAVAVINATDANGNRLPPTPGMMQLFDQRPPSDTERLDRFLHTVLPALEKATHKMSFNGDSQHDWGGPFGAFLRSHDPSSLQLLFDFQTASKATQLQPARNVRDATLAYIDKEWSQPWKENNHVRAISIVEGDCEDPTYPLARTIHGELDVPWFLTGFGPGYRDAILDSLAVESGVPTTIGQAKFVVHVPCSLKAAALHSGNNATAQPLRAVMEYGHGLFYSRKEAGESFLINMANENGYIITAMDWRGMSQYDYPLILKTMLSKPSLFESVRDNLIQGYANKFALQHFTRNGMANLPWFQFSHLHEDESGETATYSIPMSLEPKEGVEFPRVQDESGTVPSIFYGISQGGILGAGYLGLAGATGLIDRGALGVPGSPFSLILSRSLEFVGYDAALLLNFYNNRHVRIFLSLAQMCWDSVEAAGVLGLPVEEPVPPIVMQAGLGDPIVPSLAAERLARALGASTLPHNPRGPIFGIPVGEAADTERAGSKTVLTEMLYQEDYEAIPVDDALTTSRSGVHECVRREPVLQHQLNIFFQTGRIIDPCALSETACVRATC